MYDIVEYVASPAVAHHRSARPPVTASGDGLR
jgi:hypothetical protein